MTEENERRLASKFPELYREYRKKDSCMGYGFTCNDGWFDLLSRLSDAIDRIAREHGVTVVAKQVKEKLGGLRFYYSVKEKGTSETKSGGAQYRIVRQPTPVGERISFHLVDPVCEALRKVVDAAEKESLRTCELCGQPGSLKRMGGLLQTLCDPCHVQVLAERSSR
ncbi:MAG: hypothetical protein ACYDBP_00240 [Leptospirales bacterium]